ncbi:hypothetical protein [Arthrobacter sp. MMS18-M83]|uniref:hypothetical protein n=1 Tax=Arthrobacter sp. MMS18-M83 TaxID=2996261 RepID=UPI00227C8B9B|nr:hypothetical protein [Arthrobacter sp. MMS18-M83]WAH99755.1 hypothetical protein OW521_23900 [Arthrobacter sp. MMS18-M83]
MSRRSAELPDTTKPTPGPWLKVALIITILVVLVVAVASWYALRPAPQAVVDPTPTATSAPVGPGLANGCLAGPDRTAAALIAAQGKAPHTTLGAIELTAAFLRWQAQYPFPPAGDSGLVSKTMAAAKATPDMKDLAGTFSARPVAQPGQTITTSMAQGKYFVESAEADQAQITVGSTVVINGTAVDPQNRGVSFTVTLVWESGVWKISKMEPSRVPDQVFSQGTSFVGGC